MLNFSSKHRYHLFVPSTDMRKSFAGLCGLVRQHFPQSPMSGDVFIFLNKRRNKLKLLVWDRTGFVIYYKQLVRGTFELPSPKVGEQRLELDWTQLVLLLEGIELKGLKKRKRYSKKVA